MFLIPLMQYERIVPNHKKVPFLCFFAVAHGVQGTMEVTPPGQLTKTLDIPLPTL